MRSTLNETRYLHGKRQSYGTPQLSDRWGGFDYFIEIVGQFANRQVNVFGNGEILRYSRDHWCDQYGMMFIGKYSLKEKAASDCEIITECDFEKRWQQALKSSNWADQQTTAKMDQWGSWAERVAT